MHADLVATEGGGLFKFQTPPPAPQTPPKFSNPSFSNLRFWGKVLAPKALKLFFWPPDGECFFLPYVSVLKTRRIWWRIHKWVRNTQKKIDPDLTSGSDLG